ncbi:MAG: PQQ-dependent sugar dehydrogenase [Verrucomicrobiae bacterium]|nr:PQQ-dependent sugar dehydrogenase [Verrucomicrobiae bacterium]
MKKRSCSRLALILLLCGISVAITADAEDATGYDENRFSAAVLAEKLVRPLELDVAADGRVFYIELDGRVKIYHPDSGEVTTAAELSVFAEQEGGLIGMTLDPDFTENQWIYLMYSPPSEIFVGEYVSRFVMDDDVVDRNTEKVILKIPVQREDCCHHAGSLEFGPAGNLFISTGDNTHPAGDSGGYAPIDERPGKEEYDAQDTAGNTNDLRGKILRIRPMADGNYSIPDGNLFVKGGEIAGLPEIYVMGCRNPWRMNVDQKTGYVYWGEVGPDAGGDGPRGPRGYDELNQARTAGNFGWPFFIANNRPYADHDYVTGKTGALYDAERPMNISPSNTGSQLLPKPQPAWIYYPYAASEEFPMLGSGGRTACAGPVYHFDPNLDSPTKLPEALDNSLIMFDWQRTFIKRVKLDADSNIVSIDPFLTNIPIKRPVDMRIGPEGALYVLDYGETWGVNEDARLLRIDYFKGNRPPVAAISASPGLVSKHPFEARFSGAESSDPDDGDVLTYTWFVSPGAFEMQTGEQATFVFDEPGIFDVTLSVKDEAGLEDKASVKLAIGNDPPAIQFIEPLDGGFFEWGDEVAYRIVAKDAEDGSSEDASDFMKMRLLLNHFVNATAPGTAEAAYLSGMGKNSAGLSLIQQSDCLNCHAVDRKIIGPSFKEIALRYAKIENPKDAVTASANRIIKGSSKVWGEAPMLPHAQFSQEQARTIVRWVYSLADESNDSAVRQEFAGTTKLDRPDWMKEVGGGAAVWQASYTDLGANGVPALTAKAEVRLRTRQVEAEHFSSNTGTQVLASKTASSGQFIGSISNGNSLMFDRINLHEIASVTARIASPTAGGVVELRQGSATGAVLAELKFDATGEWEKWIEVSAPITAPGELIDLCVAFVNPRDGQPFMNIDWLRFDK